MMLLVGPIAGRLTTKVQVRFLLGGGLALVGIGILLMHGVKPGDSWLVLIVGFIVAGIGSGMASGINSTFRQVGIASGVAGLGAIFQHQVGAKMNEGLAGTPAAGHADQLTAAVTAGQTDKAIASIPGLPPDHVEALRQVAEGAFVSGLNTLFIVTSLIALIGAVGALILVRQSDFVVNPEAPPPPEPEAEPPAQ